MKNLIVLARVEMSGVRTTGRMVKRDLNWFQEAVAAPEAKALVYSSDMADLEKARAYAATEGWSCWVMPNTEGVLQKARERALAELPALAG